MGTNDDSNDSEPILKVATLVSAVGIGIFMSSMDASIVVVILESIQIQYDVSPSVVQWTILSYLLMMMAFTVISGDLGDRISNKVIFQIGMIIFGVGSLVCYIALDFIHTSIFWLFLGRVIQALGATGMMANGMALVTRFTTVKNRGTAVGFNNLIISIAVILGPVFGTVIGEYWSLGGVFLINVPLAVIGFILVQFNIPKKPPLDDCREADYVGSILFALFLTTLVLSFTIFPEIFAEEPIIKNAGMWFGIVIGISFAILPFLILWEKRIDCPLIDFQMLRNKKISVGLVTAILKHQGYIVIIYHFSLFLPKFGITQTAIQLGLVLAGVAVGMALFAGISGKLSDTIDARYLCTAAMIGVGIMQTVLAFSIAIDAPLWLYIATATVIGICIGMFQSPNANSIMSAAPKDKLGIAGGLHGLTTSIGINFGIALSTAVLVSASTIWSNFNELPANGDVNYVLGLKWVFAIFATITFLGAILSFFRGPEERKDNIISENC